MIDFPLSAGLIAAGAALAGPAAVPPDAPVHLVAQAAGDGVRITVVGRSASALDARYSLEVTSGASGNTNRSTQRGSVRLVPGVPVTMTTVTLGTVVAGGWSARLKVEPAGAPAYEEVRNSFLGLHPTEQTRIPERSRGTPPSSVEALFSAPLERMSRLRRSRNSS